MVPHPNCAKAALKNIDSPAFNKQIEELQKKAHDLSLTRKYQNLDLFIRMVLKSTVEAAARPTNPPVRFQEEVNTLREMFKEFYGVKL